MKKFNLIFAFTALVMGGFLFTSCEDTAGTGPDISFLNDQNSTTLSEGVTSYDIAGTITSDAGLESVRFSKVTDMGKTQLQLVESFTDKNNYQFQFSVTNITEDVTIEIEATDKDAVQNSANFTIHVAAAAGIKSWTAILGGGGSSTGSFFASASGTVYKSSEAVAAASSIDIIFYYGTAAGLSGAGLYAPSSAIKEVYSAGGGKISTTFGTLNTTKFASTSLNVSQFDAVTTGAAIASSVATPTADAIQVAGSTVYGFTTVGGKKGLIKVVSVPADNNGTCSIAVKVQE